MSAQFPTDEKIIDSTPDPTVIRAAGGVIWNSGPDVRRLALIHRPKHRDWSLPKGKLEAGETWAGAALREVLEEAGCEVRITGFAGLVSYVVKSRPKVVLYWNMERIGDRPFVPNREVDRLEWLTAPEAMARLTHPGERSLLNENRL